jgi:isocitrate dehydrogenase
LSKKAAVMKGDGIGPEVVDSMLRVLKECNFQSELILCEAGSEQWEKNGRKDASYIPDSTMKTLEEADCCFKGPTTTIPVPGAPRSVNLIFMQISDQLKLMTD